VGTGGVALGVVLGVTVTLGLTGCSGTSATATSAGTSTSEPPSTATATAAGSVMSTPRATASVSVIPCERLTSAQVAVWLGSPVITTVPADLAAVGEQGDGPAIQKLDGCLYQSATGALGYDVLSLAGQSQAAQIDLVEHQIPETSGTQAFDPGIGAHSYGFTSPMGASTFAVVHVLADDRLTTVSLTLPGATAAVARQRAVAVAGAMRG
jgi:hypothetical protein